MEPLRTKVSRRTHPMVLAELEKVLRGIEVRMSLESIVGSLAMTSDVRRVEGCEANPHSSEPSARRWPRFRSSRHVGFARTRIFDFDRQQTQRPFYRTRQARERLLKVSSLEGVRSASLTRVASTLHSDGSFLERFKKSSAPPVDIEKQEREKALAR